MKSPASTPSLSRRGFCASATSTLACCALRLPAAIAGEVERPLWQSAQEKGFLFGASFAVHELDKEHGASYAATYAQDARVLTSELEFKMASLRPEPGAIDFSGADRLVAFAKEHALAVRGHTLIWQDNLPEWIKSLDARSAGELLTTHIDAVVGRYRDTVKYWDVVNEPIGPWDRLPGNLRKGPFLAALGEDYIVKAFETARRIAPHATLVLNEAQTEPESDNGKLFRESLLALLARLKDKGAPIDAIGLQSHLWLKGKFDPGRFTEFLEELAARGYEIHVTELDVIEAGFKGSTAERDAAVAAVYERYLNAVLKVPAVRVVETWQLSDATSWMMERDTREKWKLPGEPRPLLYDKNFKKKPAWYAVERAFRNAPPR